MNCEECHENYTYCTVCDEFISEDEALYHHYHVFLSGDGEWIGAGGENMCDSYEEDIKASFFAVLNKTGIAIPLKRTIEHNRLTEAAIHLYGSILGCDGVHCYLEDEDGRLLHNCGDAFTRDLAGEQEEAMAYGVKWLISLDDDTKDANDMTLYWIEEWQKTRGGAS